MYSNIDYSSLSKPSNIIDLPDELEEISGLETFGENQIISIDDESGIVYVIDTKTGEIIRKYNFDTKGDFEGLAYDGKYIYAITSSGKLYKVDPENPENPEKFKWNIEGKEIESLAFHKGKLYSMTKEKDDAQEIKLFALEPSKLGKSQPQPALTIDLETIKTYLAKDEDESFLKEFTKFLSGDNIYNFIRPSGISFLNQNDHLLILSHHNRFLLEIKTNGEIEKILSLSYEDFHQPEGITVDQDGNLYISNESRGHLPNILKYNYN